MGALQVYTYSPSGENNRQLRRAPAGARTEEMTHFQKARRAFCGKISRIEYGDKSLCEHTKGQLLNTTNVLSPCTTFLRCTSYFPKNSRRRRRYSRTLPFIEETKRTHLGKNSGSGGGAAAAARAHACAIWRDVALTESKHAGCQARR